MGRPKKVKPPEKPVEVLEEVVAEEVVTTPQEVIHRLSVDYGREDLNDMARKINEIITHMYGRH